MNLAVVPATNSYDRILGIRDRFAAGGSWGSFILAVAAILLVLLVLPALIERMARRRRRRQLHNPKRLFLEVLRSVQLTVPQRDLLRRIARDMRMAHPAVLLISPAIYHENANSGMSATRSANEQMRARLDALAGAIFGEKS